MTLLQSDSKLIQGLLILTDTKKDEAENVVILDDVKELDFGVLRSSEYFLCIFDLNDVCYVSCNDSEENCVSLELREGKVLSFLELHKPQQDMEFDLLVFLSLLIFYQLAGFLGHGVKSIDQIKSRLVELYVLLRL